MLCNSNLIKFSINVNCMLRSQFQIARDQMCVYERKRTNICPLFNNRVFEPYRELEFFKELVENLNELARLSLIRMQYFLQCSVFAVFQAGLGFLGFSVFGFSTLYNEIYQGHVAEQDKPRSLCKFNMYQRRQFINQ